MATPDTAPDFVCELTTRPESALIYRLSGDYNPVHADPKAAAKGGFAQPILHGLCSYGVAGWAVTNLLCDGDASRLRRFDLRFTTPVYPGETLRTEVWKQGTGVAAFRVRVPARDVIVLNNGRAEYLP